MRTLITNIGELTTNAPVPEPGDGGDDLCGTLHDAAVLIDGDRIAWVGPAAEAISVVEGPSTGSGTERGGLTVVDAAGRAVIPGFVDSHSHLVFGGDRAAEFEARMQGQKYAAGGIRSTVAATRAATDDELRIRLRGFLDEMLAQGTTTVEIKSGYGLDVATEERLVRLAAEVTGEVTFLGAHVVPSEYADRGDDYVDLVTGEMLDACAPHAKWIDVFCETGAFTVRQSRRVLEAG
ncbi:MAG: amidohydrolase family protein, partial [Actinobacteria bacterium]|nr:amidohydrolase family protein [Actinomycetota bacterium]